MKEFYSFDNAKSFAELNSFIMVRMVDVDNDEVLFHFFKYDNDGNIHSRKKWINTMFYEPDEREIFKPDEPNSEFDDGDFYSSMWYVYE
jgi:hypothetical protein